MRARPIRATRWRRRAPPRPMRAGKVALPPDVAAPQALAAIATDCLGQIGGNAEALRAGRDGEFLHQLRSRHATPALAFEARGASRKTPAEIASIDRGLVVAGRGARSGARLGRVCRRDAGRDRAASGTTRSGAAFSACALRASRTRAARIARRRRREAGIAALHLPAARRWAGSRIGARARRPRSAGGRARPRRARQLANGACASAASAFAKPTPRPGTGCASRRRNCATPPSFLRRCFAMPAPTPTSTRSPSCRTSLGRLNDMAAAARLVDELAGRGPQRRRAFACRRHRARLDRGDERARARTRCPSPGGNSPRSSRSGTEPEPTMLESAEIGHRIAKDVYAREEPKLREALLQRAIRSVADPARTGAGRHLRRRRRGGRGETANKLTEWMDPRHIRVVAFGPPHAARKPCTRRPWRYWRALPPSGRVGIFMNAWYNESMRARMHGRIDDDRLEAHLQAIRAARADAERRRRRAAQVLDPPVQGATRKNA